MYPARIGAQNMRTGDHHNYKTPEKVTHQTYIEVRDKTGRNVSEYEVTPPYYVRCFTEILRNEGYYCANNFKCDYQFNAPFTAWDEISNEVSYKDGPTEKPFFYVRNFMVTHESRIWQRKDEALTVKPQDVIVPAYFPDIREVRDDIARKYSNIEEMDRQVGELMAELEADSLLDNTIIMFWSDHGGNLLRQKRAVGNSGLHVPLIKGVQFNNAFANMAVSGASRASVMTGIRPSINRFKNYYSKASIDAPNAIPLNKIFKDNGYTTISYGKIYHHNDDNEEYWSEIDEGAIFMDYQDPVSKKRRENSEAGEFGKKGPAFEHPDVDDYTYSDGKMSKKAIERLKDLKDKNEPFFMGVGYVSAHLPFNQPEKYWDLYNNDSINIADNPFYPENAPFIAIKSQHFSSELRNSYLDIPKEGNLSDDLSRNLIHGYYASVSYLDALIGELIQSLDDLGLRDNTTIILWSDHGYFLGEHGFWCKHSTLLEAVKVLLIISSPGCAINTISSSFVELVDIYPTLCDIAQIDIPEYLHGESMLPVLKDPKQMVKKEIYTRYREGEAVIDEDYAYTEFYDMDNNEYLGNMLYDLNKDAKQNIDISDFSNNNHLIEKYKNKLEIMRDHVNKDPI